MISLTLPHPDALWRTRATSLLAAWYYVCASVLLTSVNKRIFERYPQSIDAPQLLLGQSSVAIIVFIVLSLMGRLHIHQLFLSVFRKHNTSQPHHITPPHHSQPTFTYFLSSIALFLLYQTMYVTAILSSLLALRRTSVIMFNTLRRTSIVFVVISQSIVHQQWPSIYTIFATILTLLGAFHATSTDLSFDIHSYGVALLASITTACYLVLVNPVRYHLNVSNLQLQVLSTIFSLPPLLFLLTFSESRFATLIRDGAHPSPSPIDLLHRTRSLHPEFQVLYLSSCLLAILLTHSTYVNASTNSAVAQIVAAQVKDSILFAVSYFLVDSPHLRTRGNLHGVLISLLGSMVYAVGRIRNAHPKQPDASTPPSSTERVHQSPSVAPDGPSDSHPTAKKDN